MDNEVKREIKAQIARSGWRLTDIIKEYNTRHPDAPTTVQNISSKLTRGTIKYAEVMEIADIIGCKIEWLQK